MTENSEQYFMNLASELAKKGANTCFPNPLVGALIGKNHKIIGQGFHEKAGEAHAEINAINSVNNPEDIYDATLYVTLEPCSTFGETPPCTQSIISHRIKHVVIGTIDPNPKHAGKAVDILKAAGLSVKVLNDPKISQLNEKFNWYITKQKPFIHIKWAMSLDGRIATSDKDSKWISNDLSRMFVQKLRSEHSAILSGIGTIIADDPQLNIRLSNYDGLQPYKIILDSQARIPLTSKILESSKNILIVGKSVNEDKLAILKNLSVKIIKTNYLNNKLDFNSCLPALAQLGINSIFTEAGPTIITSLIKEKLVNRVSIFIAPKIIGGINNTVTTDLKIQKLINSINLKNIETKHFADDIFITGIIADND